MRSIAIPPELTTLEMVSVAQPVFDIQWFLESRGSGLAKAVMVVPGLILNSKEKVSVFLARKAKQFNLRPQWILTVLQSEQSLISDPSVYDTTYKVYNLPTTGALKPAPSHGGFILMNNPAKALDGNSWVEIVGQKKMCYAMGAGVPDPGIMPNWDVRKYVGFDNQVHEACFLIRKYLDNWNSEDPKKRQVTLYSGETVVCADPETYAMLMYTPNPSVLVDRPRIYRSYFA